MHTVYGETYVGIEIAKTTNFHILRNIFGLLCYAREIKQKLHQWTSAAHDLVVDNGYLTAMECQSNHCRSVR